MYRIETNGTERTIYGVLADYDLASWTGHLKNHYTPTSRQRTGTPPYMACELLLGESDTHLYRHDLESLFYIMLLLCTRHIIAEETNGKTKKTTGRLVMRGADPRMLPYANWFDTSDYVTLGEKKQNFCMKLQRIELSPSFEAFRPWLQEIQLMFSHGFAYKEECIRQRKTLQFRGLPFEEAVPIDDETLGGKVSFPLFTGPTHQLTGKLKLIVRYPSKPSLPTNKISTEA